MKIFQYWLKIIDAKKVNIIKNLAKNPDQLELVEADLENVESWKDAIKGMEVVM
jgi:hypothetical protein